MKTYKNVPMSNPKKGLVWSPKPSPKIKGRKTKKLA